MKVILDTNVLVSALISAGNPSLVLEKVIESDTIQVCLSTLIFEEYLEVLARPKFQKFPSFIENTALVLHFLKTIP